MPVIAIRQSAAQAMTARQRKLARWVLKKVGLIDPAQFTAPGGNVWLVFDDEEIDLEDVAYFGRFAALLASIPNGYDPPDQLDNATAGQARTFVRNWLVNHIVWPVVVPEGQDPYGTVLAAQSAPASVQAAGGVPSTWTPN